MARLMKIQGVDLARAEKLRSVGIRTAGDLLKECGPTAGRKRVSQFTGISEQILLRYTKRADLLRIRGVGEEYADLLEADGVDTVVELACRDAENLLRKIREVNGEKKLVRQIPGIHKLKDWINQAGRLPRAIHH